MAASMTSQNKWPVHTNQTSLAVLSWVTGRVRPGDVHTVLNYLCERFHREVEPIRRADSWGYAYRPIRGKVSGFSNHSSGTAIDLNATTHPLGVRNTFSPAKIARIALILSALDGVVRWGGHYSGRPDDMHFEINVGPGSASLARVAARIRGGSASPGVPSTGDKPAASKPTPPAPTPPKEDTLSAAEVNQIIDTLTARMDAKFRDLQANGFDRGPAQFIAKEVWDNSFVYRGAEKKPTSAKQELADSKSLAMQAVAQNAALAEAQLQLSKTGKIDYVKMGDVVREAIEDTITIGGKK